MPHADPIIAVDIGNSRIKIGIFTKVERPIPSPASVIDTTVDKFEPSTVENWLHELPLEPRAAAWWIASVNRPPTDRLVQWLDARGLAQFQNISQTGAIPGHGCYHLLKYSNLKLTINVQEPDRVGIDRLLGALAANSLRAAGRPAIVIDLGSAITVDLIDANGAFRGGAILPGIGMSTRAMHLFTDRLPLVPMEELVEPPPPLGDSTIAAMRSGLYWGAVGAMKELIARLTASPHANAPLDIFLTGGAAATVAAYIDPRARWMPDLVLGGIALAATT